MVASPELTLTSPGAASSDTSQKNLITRFCDRMFSKNAMRGRNREPPLTITEALDVAR